MVTRIAFTFYEKEVWFLALQEETPDTVLGNRVGLFVAADVGHFVAVWGTQDRKSALARCVLTCLVLLARAGTERNK